MADSLIVKDFIHEGETLGVIAEFFVKGKTITLRVPIFGTYHKVYVRNSLQNRLRDLQGKSNSALQDLEDMSSQELIDVASRKQRSAAALSAIGLLEAEKDVVIAG